MRSHNLVFWVCCISVLAFNNFLRAESSTRVLPASALMGSVFHLPVNPASGSPASVQLYWRKNSSVGNGFQIERKGPNENFVNLGRVPMEQTYFYDETAQLGKTYTYRIATLNPISNEPDAYSKPLVQNVSHFYLNRHVLCRLTREHVIPHKLAAYFTTELPDSETPQAAGQCALPSQSQGQHRKTVIKWVQDFSITGSSDEYAMLKHAATRISQAGNAILIFPKGIYRAHKQLNSASSDISFSNTSNVRVLGCGNVQIDILPGSANQDASITPFKIQNASNFSVEGFRLNGNVGQLVKSPTNPEPSGIGVSTRACFNCQFLDLYIHHFAKDGIYIGNGYPLAGCASPTRVSDHNIRINNVVSTNNARLGLLVVHASNVWVSGSEFSNTGITGNTRFPGYAPMRGIDVEPNYFTRNKADIEAALVREANPTVRLTLAKEALSYPEIKVTENTHDVVFENIRVRNNLGGIFGAGLSRRTPIEVGVARTENLSIGYSELIAHRENVETLEMILAVSRGTLFESYLDLGRGKMVTAWGSGYSLEANRNDAMIDTSILRNEIHYQTIAIDNHWGRQALKIKANHFIAHSIHAEPININTDDCVIRNALVDFQEKPLKLNIEENQLFVRWRRGLIAPGSSEALRLSAALAKVRGNRANLLTSSTCKQINSNTFE